MLAANRSVAIPAAPAPIASAVFSASSLEAVSIRGKTGAGQTRTAIAEIVTRATTMLTSATTRIESDLAARLLDMSCCCSPRSDGQPT